MASIENLNKAKQLFGENFLGPEELKPFLEELDSNYGLTEVPEIPYSWDVLEKSAKEYILVLGIPSLHPSGHQITLMYLRDHFGVNPEISEPCFYNQDWYMAEDFMGSQLPLGWYLIKKDIVEGTRAAMPQDIMANGIKFPTAILCTYTFFAYYFAYGKLLWYHDFIWCSDTDHNGDRIYVGKYNDVDGVNKNGFSIHRHLALRPCYGAVGVL